MSETVRVAVMQTAPVIFNKDATIEKMVRLVPEATKAGAKLVLFPEAFIPCYPRGMSFGSNVGKRTDAGRKDFRLYYENSVAIPGPDCDKLAAIAAQNEVYLVTGLIEKDGGTVYCTVVFFGPDGAYLGKHRKLMPTGSERLIWGRGDGSTLTTVDTPFGRLGAVICWENYMPLLRATMYGKGVDIYLAPTADSRDSWQATLQHIAIEGRCFVIGCNQYVTKDMYPKEVLESGELDSEPEVMCRGGSAVLNPLGKYVCEPLYGKEGMLIADLDMGVRAEGQYDFDVAGHYGRHDVFNLVVDERAKTGLTLIKN